MRSKVVSLQVGNFHVGKSWQLESERFTCLREGGDYVGHYYICWGTTTYVGHHYIYVGAPQPMLGSTMLGHHFKCGGTNIYLHV